jgi:hypothetical protein
VGVGVGVGAGVGWGAGVAGGGGDTGEGVEGGTEGVPPPVVVMAMSAQLLNSCRQGSTAAFPRVKYDISCGTLQAVLGIAPGHAGYGWEAWLPSRACPPPC